MSHGYPRVGLAVVVGLVGVVAMEGLPVAEALPEDVQQRDLVGPAGSGEFGSEVVVLSNGNYVVTDPGWDNGPLADVGAVYLYDGTTDSLLATLTGTKPNDLVGFGGVTALTTGNYVVTSPLWDKDETADVGAVTWGDGTTGITGTVSVANSLTGTTPNGRVGFGGVTALTNGNYVVISQLWNDGGTVDVGAVTWGDGTTGTAGTVTVANSLTGTTPFDRVGNGGVTALTNGNYVVTSQQWDNGENVNVGAVTWGDGTTGTAGNVTNANSLTGTTPFDLVGSSGVTALTTGNYVVTSPQWDNGENADVGAVTWGDGTTGTAGNVTTANSLTGTTPSNLVGSSGVTALTNGNYVVSSPFWDNGETVNVGAVTWGDGTTGTAGNVTVANSLTGTTPSNLVGFGQGRKEKNDQIDDVTAEAEAQQLAWFAATVEQLKTQFDYSKLDNETQTSYDLWIYQYERMVEAAKFRDHNYWFNQMRGMHSMLPQMLMNFHKVDEVADLAAYIKRIGGIAKAIADLQQRAAKSAELGVRPPRFAYEGVIVQLNNLLSGQPFTAEDKEAPLWTDINKKIDALIKADKLTDAQATQLRNDAKTALTSQFQPAYTALRDFLQAELAHTSAQAQGASALPNGVEFYNLRLKTVDHHRFDR